MARQFRKPFDGPDFHQRALMMALAPYAALVSAHDASFLPQSGKQTFGLGHYFNGCASRAERGLEMSTRAVVEVTRRGAYKETNEIRVRLLLDSRVVDVPMASNLTFVMLSSWKPLFFNSLKNDLCFSDNAGV
jgi:hypothetical protein